VDERPATRLVDRAAQRLAVDRDDTLVGRFGNRV
jgi:hypothetical protein